MTEEKELEQARSLDFLADYLLNELPTAEFVAPAIASQPWTWPKDQFIAHCRAFSGLTNGELAPLAEFIRSGLPLHRSLAAKLLEAIDGGPDAPFKLKLVGRRGVRKSRDRQAAHERKIRVGLYVLRRQKEAERGHYEATITAAADYFGIGRGTVNDAVAYLRAAEGAFDWIMDVVEVGAKFPDE